jgi:hypothetical protein
MKTPSTILYPKAFWRSLPAGFDGAFHWEWLEDGVHHIRGITPDDRDGIVEINHYTLQVETKGPTSEISRGKTIELEAAVDTGLVTVMAVWGKESPERCRIRKFKKSWYTLDQGGYSSLSAAMTGFVKSWADWADRKPKDAWRRTLIQAAFHNANPGILDVLLARARHWHTQTIWSHRSSRR